MSNREAVTVFDHWQTIFAATVFFVSGPIIFLIMPVYIGALAQQLGFSDRELGFTGSADLAGMAIASIFMYRWVKTNSWRTLAGTSLLVSALGNLVSVYSGSFELLLGVRFVTGFGSGMVLAVVYVLLARTSHPDRITGIFIFAQVAASVLILYGSPVYLRAWGLNGIYVGLVILNVALIPLVRLVPAGDVRDQEAAVSDAGPAKDRGPLFLVLFSLVFFFIGQSSLWAFIERIGTASGFDQDYLAFALAVSTLAGLIGAIAASLLDIKFGRTVPIVISAGVQLVCIMALVEGVAASTYLVALSVFQVFWSFAVPYQYGVAISCDRSRNLVVLILAFQAVGVASGPALAGLATVYGYTGVNLISAGAILVYLVLILPQTRVSR